MRVLESNIELTDAINPEVARVLVIVEPHVNFKGFYAISPVEDRRLLGKDLKSTQLFTLTLGYTDSLICLVDHGEPRLEADQFREGKRLG